ncbi:acetyl-CoA carboxylase biotin carboxylase subunit family protein [Streptomyces monticola]|uniref:Acetyl-CoA carboxylase biotin carboxylase subunit family protein n=1 Tax=Streptomyces monticola TaxID=2666263 RepID=A0ABW2JUG3_9ACTN
MEPADIFVLGLDEKNRAALEELPLAELYRFHPLLTHDELQQGEIPIAEFLERARRQLTEFGKPVDAVVGYWDFPVSTMVPILCREFGLRGPSLEAVVKCEHKYWSRLEQRKVIDEYPRFGLVDLEGPPRPPEGLRYPLWLKPVKSYSSELAFKVRDDEEYAAAVAEIREGIGRLGRPFEHVMDRLDLPPEIAEAGGQACLAEETLSGAQVTVEGYSWGGRVEIYGVVDSLNYPGTSSFLRYQYPSTLPDEIQDRLAEVSRKVIAQIGLDHSTFCIEYFCDLDTGTIGLLEVNPRHSQSHAEVFAHVDGIPNHHCMVSLALGEDPQLPYRQGPYKTAAKWFLRRFEDGVVSHRASEKDIERLREEIPGVGVVLHADVGDRLSELPQASDSYSYELAHVYAAAAGEAELRDKYERCVRALDFRFEDDPAADTPEEGH